MDDTTTITTTTTSTKTNASTKASKIKKRRLNGESKEGGAGGGIDGDDDKDDDDEECDVEAWDTLSKSFRQVQTVLDQNRDLIKQVNANHQSKIPDNLAKNVSLIREIDGNISKVMSIYSDLSVNFSSKVHERRRFHNSDDGGAGGGGGGGGGGS